MRGHSRVRHVAEHPEVVAQLELLRVAVQPELGDPVADARVPFDQVLELVICHRVLRGSGGSCSLYSLIRSLARKALKEGQMSSLRSISTEWKLGASSRRNTLSIEDS